MIIVVIFVIIPFVLGFAVQYALCRLTKRRLWRWASPLVLLALGAGVAWYRYQMWSSEVPVWTQLLFVPGLPVLAAVLGVWLGWRFWRRRSRPRIIWDRDRR